MEPKVYNLESRKLCRNHRNHKVLISNQLNNISIIAPNGKCSSRISVENKEELMKMLKKVNDKEPVYQDNFIIISNYARCKY